MEPWSKPTAGEFWDAVAVYLRLAYDGQDPPGIVARRVHAVRESPELWECSVFERDPEGTRYCLRLGNPRYLHMKLVVERCPDGSGYLFRADTHDKHIRPAPDSREAEDFRLLIEFNQQLAQRIEDAWAQRGLMTFRTFLKNDLDRRRGGG